MADSTEATPVIVSLVAVPAASAAVLYGMHEVFSAVGTTWEVLTGQHTEERRMAPQIVARSRRTFRSNLNVPISPDCSFGDTGKSDIVIVPDLDLQPGGEPDFDTDSLDWLNRQFDDGAIVCSVCTGALMLAAAGLLDELEATTHWSATDLLAARHPRVRLCPERILSPAGPGHRIVTSGGSASWADLLLYLVARFSGPEEARRIAKVFLFGDRSDGQLPFAALARPRQHEDSVIADCQAWIAMHYEQANPVASLVERSGLTPRTFSRRFSKATGYTPIEYVQTLRIEEAKQMLESTDDAVEEVAANVGYDDPGSFRRLFKRLTGISPRAYRQRFRLPAISQHLPPVY